MRWSYDRQCPLAIRDVSGFFEAFSFTSVRARVLVGSSVSAESVKISA